MTRADVYAFTFFCKPCFIRSRITSACDTDCFFAASNKAFACSSRSLTLASLWGWDVIGWGLNL